MRKKKLDLNTLHDLHRKGQLEQAKAGYLAVLRTNPRNADVLHSLGIIFTQQENFPQATQYFQKAIQHQPNNPSIQLHLANVLKFQKLFNEAAQILKNTIAKNPDYIPAYNNLGTIYYEEGKLNDAIIAYQEAISKQPDYMDAYYNLALALTKKNNLNEAIATYQHILTVNPDHFVVRFHLGCIYMLQNNIELAIKEFLAIEEMHPHHFETHSNLATCYLKQGALNEAKAYYLKALELHPDDAQILFNLGVMSIQQGDIDHAIQYYQRALTINPDSFEAHNNIGVAFLAKQHAAYAVAHFKEALRIQPDNKALTYTISMLSQNRPLLSAHPDYVQSLFDSYADHYEPHLLTALEYKLPSLFHKIGASFMRRSSSLSILDLGCGTGLCGTPFKPYATYLTGVDLSSKMLEVAAQKNSYDELIQMEFLTFLRDKTASYDLILAADAFVYIGDLDTAFQLVRLALRDRGLFMFNTEIGDEVDYKMNQSGRFSHRKSYLDSLSVKHHFKILHYETCVTRMQNNEPVYGHLYLFMVNFIS